MPSVAVIDSQSVKGGHFPPLSCGYDACKKIKGRKRHVLTDTNGLLLHSQRGSFRLLGSQFCHR